MKFSIMSRNQAKKYTYTNFEEKIAIVSINDLIDGKVNFRRSDNLMGVCTVFFDDVELKEEENLGYMFMTTEDAEKIKNFVDFMWDKIDHLIVHCYAGISRSSGCMSAILRAKGLSDDWIWENKKYSPNTYVAKKVLEAYGIDHNNYDVLWQKLLTQEED